jgi:hypothetical protein
VKFASAMLSLLALGLASCVGMSSPEPSFAVRRVSVQPADYVGIAWLTSGSLVITRAVPSAPEGTRLGFELLLVDPVSGQSRVLDVPPVESCWRELYLSPRALPAGEVAFSRSCLHSVDGNPPDSADVVGMDVVTQNIRTLMPLGLLTGSKNPAIAVAPAADRVIYDVGAGVCVGIAVAVKGQPEGRLDAEVRGDGRTFNLNTPADLHSSCAGEGRAGGPALAPSGEDLAFGASPGSVGVDSNEARLATPWNLYVMPMGTMVPVQIASGLAGASGIAWSPEGTVISFLGTLNGRDEGIWVASRDGGTVSRVALGDFGWLAWSPDGTEIAALRWVPGPAGSSTYEVVIVPVSLPTTKPVGEA